MAKVSLLEDSEEELSYTFYCAGCKSSHFFTIRSGVYTREHKEKPPGLALWSWNNNFEKPTIEPSIHCWPYDKTKTCHSFIRDGMIQYLPDSVHHLRGKTIEMEDDD